LKAECYKTFLPLLSELSNKLERLSLVCIVENKLYFANVAKKAFLNNLNLSPGNPC
jgi:hypothetical protein